MTLKTEVKAGWFFVFFFVIFSFARGENAPFSHSEHTHTHVGSRSVRQDGCVFETATLEKW